MKALKCCCHTQKNLIKFICICNASDDGRMEEFGGKLLWGEVVAIAARKRQTVAMVRGKDVHHSSYKSMKKEEKNRS